MLARGNKVGFGKYRDLTIEDLIAQDPGYVRWALRDCRGFAISAELRAEIDAILPSPSPKSVPEQSGGAAGTETSPEIEAGVAKILADLEGKPYEWLLIILLHDLGFDSQIHSSREELIQDMASAIATGQIPVGLYHQGRELSQEEETTLIAQAKRTLRGSSRFKAEGGIF